MSLLKIAKENRRKALSTIKDAPRTPRPLAIPSRNYTGTKVSEVGS
jgi:hypothetical protein